ncbi:MAG: oxidoreductase [Candidatus Niyogibacteria bacterium CG10_big_fil_rev_8_21_14_0_10_46_36]|uniref:Oxidoreductase n=1 Tax=Candidatus Niyogibacteria bacterium CG10_big_fil_rev_8_21_14_0_10_46_36 TaxID=1974726 RepID=A0A2H0TE11_9BACT|nr:MAG: oxidoreductase [Candidatus Niyogibacteria bacterium CG10_big_fil_rev_8_21_14_0_10_46_36]
MPSVFPQLFDFWFVVPFLLRVLLGVIFIVHGYPKLFKNFQGTKDFFQSLGLRPAAAWVIFIGALEFFGGIFLIVGLFVQLIALLMAINMFFAIALVARKKGFANGWEFELTLLVISLALFIMGAGIFAIDVPF